MLFCVGRLRFFVGRFAALRRLSGRHKWRPYVCGRLNVVSRWLFCGVARRGAIYDARCRNGTCGRSRCVSADAGGAAVGLRFCGGWFAVFRRSVCGIAAAIRASQVAPLRLRAVECCFASVIRASQVAPLRLWAVECCFVAVIWASQVAPLRLRAVDCCFASVIRASQVAPLRLRVVDCCFAGGCWRRNGGLSEEGDGYEKKKPD